MGVEGYALAIVVAVLLCVVLPALLRRREVLAEARIDERYAEELRILDVRESENREHANEPHGTIFFRQPEVIMSQNDKARTSKAPVGDVRALARDRARRKARMSKRGAHRRLGYVGGGALGGFAALGWVLTALTTIPVAVPITISILLGVYLVGLSYLTSAMAQADAADRQAIASIDKRLGGIRRDEGVRKVAGAKGDRARADGSHAAAEASKAMRHEAAQDAGTAVAKELAVETEANESATLTIDQAAERDATAEGTAQAADEAADGAEHAVTMNVAQAGSVAATERREVVPAARKREAAEAAVPSYTLKPRAFARRTVTPYAPPEVAASAVPYRPKNVGERFDDVDNTAAASTHAADGLGGGATLDQMLNRRRA
ncbi:hypothetical protein I6E29_05835 [Arcanobacterium haemolyticum]|nr:hypothetical protein [Arcanobacterium haemolyticum]